MNRKILWRAREREKRRHPKGPRGPFVDLISARESRE